MSTKISIEYTLEDLKEILAKYIMLQGIDIGKPYDLNDIKIYYSEGKFGTLQIEIVK